MCVHWCVCVCVCVCVSPRGGASRPRDPRTGPAAPPGAACTAPPAPGSPPPTCRRRHGPLRHRRRCCRNSPVRRRFAGERNGRPPSSQPFSQPSSQPFSPASGTAGRSRTAVDIPAPTRRCLVQCLVAGGIGQDLFVGGTGLGLGAVATGYLVQPLRPAAFRNLRRHLRRRRAKRNRAPFARPAGQKRPSSFRNLARRHSGTSPEAGVPTSGGSRKLPISHSSQTPAPISASPVVARRRRAADRRRCVAPS